MDGRGAGRLGKTMARELVTVLMPVRDTPASMLKIAIDSICGQTFADFEYLMVDDGSERPETRECLARAAAQDPRVRLERTGEIGVTRALNLGLGSARGELIARQDADDWSEPQRLARQIEFLAAHPAAVCGTAAWRHRRDGAPLWIARMPCSHEAILQALESGNPFFHGSAMFRRDAALRIGGYRDEFCCAQDYDFFWRLSETGTAANLAEPLYHYRHDSGSVSAVGAAAQLRAHRAARMLAQARRRGEVEDVARALADAGEFSALARLKQGDHCLLAGDYPRAWKAYWSALKRDPSSARAWGKVGRCALFAAVPAARALTFGEG